MKFREVAQSHRRLSLDSSSDSGYTTIMTRDWLMLGKGKKQEIS